MSRLLRLVLVTFLCVAVVAAALAGTVARTQTTSIFVSPPNPQLEIGQTQQFTVLDDAGRILGATRVRVAGGPTHTCALTAAGGVECWGLTDANALFSDYTVRTRPVAVPGVSAAVSIVVGSQHACAERADGTVLCWGHNFYGELGNGVPVHDLSNRAFDLVAGPPVAATLGGRATAITAGGTDFSYHTCALLADTTVQCWGRNNGGQLGNGTLTDTSTPIAVSDLTGVVALAAGESGTCAVLQDGTVKCWGLVFQLPGGNWRVDKTPVAVSGLSGVATISGGKSHFCALRSDGTAACWGSNDYGELGDGTTTLRTAPVSVNGLSEPAVGIGEGQDHTCALLATGMVQCWGVNQYGSIGLPTDRISFAPVTVSGVTDAIAISTGLWHTCALSSVGTLKCWGWNAWGQLGNESTTNSSSPVPTEPLITWSSSDPSVATIDPVTGQATGLANGTATITATYDAMGLTAETTVTVGTPTVPPVITSPDNVTFTVGSAGSFSVTATGTPAPTISEVGVLPAGVAFTDGVLIGTPAPGTSGFYNLTFIASNGAPPNATQTFTLTVDEAPVITSPASAIFETEKYSSLVVSATGAPKPIVSVSGTLPAGLTFTPIVNDPSRGYLGGVPASGTSGSYTVTIKASNSVGEAVQTFTLKVIGLKSIGVAPVTPSLAVGLTMQFTASAAYDDGSTRDVTSSGTLWSSSNSRATITAGGLATGVHQGTVTITARYLGMSASTNLTVAAPVLVSLAVSPATATIATLGQTQQFVATGTYSDGHTTILTKIVAWSSTCAAWPTCAAVTMTNGGNGGLATGTTPGTATIVATLDGVAGTATLFVVPSLVSVKITPVNPVIRGLPAIRFTATGTYSDNSTQDLTKSVTWTSSQPVVASVGQTTGVGVLLGDGSTTIKAKLNGFTDSTTLTVFSCVEPTPFDFAYFAPRDSDAIAYERPSPSAPPGSPCGAYVSTYGGGAPSKFRKIQRGSFDDYVNVATDGAPLNGVAVTPAGDRIFGALINTSTDFTALPGLAFATAGTLRFSRQVTSPAPVITLGNGPFSDSRFNQGPVGPALDSTTSSGLAFPAVYFGNWQSDGDLYRFDRASDGTWTGTRLPEPEWWLPRQRITAIAFEMRTNTAANPRRRDRYLVVGRGTTITTIDIDTTVRTDVDLASACPINANAGVARAAGILSIAIHPAIGDIYVEVKGLNGYPYIVDLDLSLACRTLSDVQAAAGLTSLVGSRLLGSTFGDEGRIVVTPNLMLLRMVPNLATGFAGPSLYTLPTGGAPVANGGPDLTVYSSGGGVVVPVRLDGSASYDPEGDALVDSWTQVAGPVLFLPPPQIESGILTFPFGLPPGIFTFQLTVSDGVETASDQVTVTVLDWQPVANAGADQTVQAGTVVTLNASASTGDSLTFRWEQPGGLPLVNLSNPDAMAPTFVAPEVPASTTLQFWVTVSSRGVTSTDVVNIKVKPK
jgi:alpha-tubulin suppressor-like RCC1 family protein